MKIAEKKKRLMAILASHDALAVAFSGGVDSSLLLAAAKAALGDRVTAFTADAPFHARREMRAARATAQALGVRHIVVPFAPITDPAFVSNPPERCYTCKRLIFAEIIRRAAALGLERVAHGENRDDRQDHRPGSKAAAELGVAAPLAEAGLTKADIRALSRRMGLATWNKPAMACLASRIPYGQPITAQALTMVEAAEDVLEGLGFSGCRVRHHGPVARIELAAGDLKKALAAARRAEILTCLKRIGYQYVALDLEGYVPGSLNRALEK
jgi:uncharacterized protein